MASPEMPVESQPKQSFGERLQSMKSFHLYLVLILVCSVPLFFRIGIPNKPDISTIKLYSELMRIPEGSTVVVESDWTISTRGENGGNMEALLRILMARKIKFVMYSAADSQAPQVARDTIRRINNEREALGLQPYKKWEDWLDLGYFPDGASMMLSLASDIRKAWESKRDTPPGGVLTSVFKSPVLSNINSVSDLKMYINIHASATHLGIIQRLYKRVPLASMCTGVMVPEMVPYISSGQLVGMSGGLKGVYDLEVLMEKGLNVKDAPQQAGYAPIQPLGYEVASPRGFAYYPTLHVALFLLILAVVVGNIGMIMVKSRRTE